MLLSAEGISLSHKFLRHYVVSERMPEETQISIANGQAGTQEPSLDNCSMGWKETIVQRITPLCQDSQR